jgi:ADP-ribose pyrophosphatase
VTDASTVLPYDPVRDRILLVEQVRFGPLAQGDPAPWLLEPVAGLIDAGETPRGHSPARGGGGGGARPRRSAFRRALLPQPRWRVAGAVSYVGIADLPDEAAGLGGHAEEDEDILGHVIGFDQAMELMEKGDLVNAPTIITLQWLAVHRDRLRTAPPAS